MKKKTDAVEKPKKDPRLIDLENPVQDLMRASGTNKMQLARDAVDEAGKAKPLTRGAIQAAQRAGAGVRLETLRRYAIAAGGDLEIRFVRSDQ